MMDLLLWPFRAIGTIFGLVFSLIGSIFSAVFGLIGGVFGVIGGVLSVLFGGALVVIVIIGALWLIRWFIGCIRA